MSSHAARTDAALPAPDRSPRSLSALLRRYADEIRDFWARHPLDSRYWPPHP